MMELLDGYSSSLVTPFAEDGSIDFEELGRLVEWTLEQGVDSVIAAGSTGEGYSLTSAEKAQVVGFVVNRVAGRIPVIGGATGANMADTLATIEEVQQVGADALMVSCPPIGRLGQSEIVGYFRQCDELARLPIVVYNAPDDLVTSIAPRTVSKLAALSNIIALKESSHEQHLLYENLILNSGAIRIYGDLITEVGVEFHRRFGIAHGYMGSGALLGPDMAGFFRALGRQDWDTAGRIAVRHGQLRDELRGEGFNGRFGSMPAQVKAILRVQCGLSSWVRRPRIEVQDRDGLRKVLERHDFEARSSAQP